jgi:hypothetical protein
MGGMKMQGAKPMGGMKNDSGSMGSQDPMR